MGFQTLQFRGVGDSVHFSIKMTIPMMTIQLIQVLFQSLLLGVNDLWIVLFETYLKMVKNALKKRLL